MKVKEKLFLSVKIYITEIWSGLPFSLSQVFPTQGSTTSLLAPHCRRILYLWATEINSHNRNLTILAIFKIAQFRGIKYIYILVPPSPPEEKLFKDLFLCCFCLYWSLPFQAFSVAESRSSSPVLHGLPRCSGPLFLWRRFEDTQASVEVCGLKLWRTNLGALQGHSPRPGSNLCPLPWLEDSLPLSPGKSGETLQQFDSLYRQSTWSMRCHLSILLFQHF